MVFTESNIFLFFSKHRHAIGYFDPLLENTPHLTNFWWTVWNQMRPSTSWGKHQDLQKGHLLWNKVSYIIIAKKLEKVPNSSQNGINTLETPDIVKRSKMVLYLHIFLTGSNNPYWNFDILHFHEFFSQSAHWFWKVCKQTRIVKLILICPKICGN